jgi:hypothetical protein
MRRRENAAVVRMVDRALVGRAWLMMMRLFDDIAPF